MLEQFPVASGQALDFAITGPVLHEVGDSCAPRIGIVADHLVAVVAKVVVPRVPHTVLIVDQEHLGRVLDRGENIVLLRVVVREDNLISTEKASHHILVTRCQECLLK